MKYLYNLIKYVLLKIKFGNRVKIKGISKTHTLPSIQAFGSRVFISNNFMVNSGCHLKTEKKGYINIGENVFMNHNCIITALGNIVIGNNVKLGPNVMIFDHDHDFKCKSGINENKYTVSDIYIGDNCWIGAGCTILKGSKIGNDSIIAAGTIIVNESIEKEVCVYNKRELNTKRYR